MTLYKQCSKNGFTLIEFLISMGIMSILIVILTELFGSIIQLRQKSEATTSTAQDSRFIILRLGYDISRANSISVPILGSDSDTLSLDIAGDTYQYSLSNNDLILSLNGGPNIQLNSETTSITSLSFSRSDHSLVNQDVSVSFSVSPTTQTKSQLPISRQISTTYIKR